METSKKLGAEFIGTFALVSAVCGAALFSAGFPNAGAGIFGVAFAVGLTVMAMAFAVGHISGGHFNPAVTLGLWAGGRVESKDIVPYIIAQVAGGAAAAAVFFLIASGQADFSAGGFASNGYGAHSPAGFSLLSVFIAEVVLTALFLIIIMGATSKSAPAGFAPIAIGFALTTIHLMSIPISNTSLNPARSLATAIFADDWALQQVWMFWVAPILGGIAGGFIAKWLQSEN